VYVCVCVCGESVCVSVSVESDTTEQLHFLSFTFFGIGMKTDLFYSKGSRSSTPGME